MDTQYPAALSVAHSERTASKFFYLIKPYIKPAPAAAGKPRQAFDIEADGLLDVATKIHCISIGDLDSDQIEAFGPNPDRIKEALNRLSEAHYLTGHNITGYDLPLLQRLHGWTPSPGCIVVDTLIANRLILPHMLDLDMKAAAMGDPSLGKLNGRHRLEAWGLRLGIPKTGTEIEVWAEWTPEIERRCIGDVALAKKLWQLLQPDGQPQEALTLEHRVSAICTEITDAGIPFDVDTAAQRQTQWEKRRVELKAKLHAQFPEIKNWNSRPQLATLLKSRGWEPDSFTKKTKQPQINDDVLEALPTLLSEFTGLAEYFILGRRLGQLANGKKAWLRNVAADGRIHGRIVHIGTPHSRASHLEPNLAQVPSPKRGKPLATECRALFRTQDNWVFVTCDQAGLQDRGFSHYLAEFDGGAYAKAFLAGLDPHWAAAQALGLVPAQASRDKTNKLHNSLREGCKSWRYAFLFGMGGEKAGIIIRNTIKAAMQIEPSITLMQELFGTNAPNKSALTRAGKKALDKFVTATPGLRELRAKLKAQARHGWIPGLDGRRVPIRSLHTALNFAVTSAEAIITKRWLVQVRDELDRRFKYGWDGEVVLVGWIHDELIACCRPKIAAEVGAIMVKWAKEAGEHYNFKCTLDADFKVGRSWAGDNDELEPVIESVVVPAVVPAIEPTVVPTIEPEPPYLDPNTFIAEQRPRCLAGARVYAALGWHVFPAPSDGSKKSLKKAKYSDGRKWGMTVDPAEIERDHRLWPNANCGVVTGPVSGVWVIEADTAKGHGVDGIASLRALEAQHGPLPPTLTARSPSGSLHRYFRHPTNGAVIKNSTSKLAPGVDVRGAGGMVLAPPSLRSDGAYTWINNIPPADPPDWLVKLALAASAGADDDNDDDALKFDKALVADDMLVAAAVAVIPNSDLDWETWNRILMAIYAATEGSDAGFETADHFSQKSRKYNRDNTIAKWNALHTCPPDRIGAGTLFYLAGEANPNWEAEAVMGALSPGAHVDDGIENTKSAESTDTGNKGNGQAKSSGGNSRVGIGETRQPLPLPQPAEPSTAPIDLWNKLSPPPLPRGLLPSVIEDFAFEQGATMGADPAGLAASALTVCAAAVPDHVRLKVKRYSEWMESTRLWTGLVGDPSTKKTPIVYQATRPLHRIDANLSRVYTQEKATWDALDRNTKRITPRPLHVRVKLEDTTIEAAQEILRDSPNGVLCHRDELSGFFGAMDKYAGLRGAAADRAFWLQAYNGNSYSIDRIGRGSGFIEHLSISVLGGIQPESMRKIVADTVDDGLIQRLVPVMLRPGDDDHDEPMSDATAEYERLVERLHMMPEPAFNVEFCDAARELRQEMAHKHHDLAKVEIINKKLASHFGKYDGIYARLCLLWHCIESPGVEQITEDCARKVASFVTRFLLPHAVAFYSDIYGLSEDHENLTSVAGYILAHKLTRPLTNRDLQRSIRTMRGLKRQETESIWHQLSALGWVTQAPGRRTADPPHWNVNPEVHRRFQERAAQEIARRKCIQEKLAEISAQ